MIVYCITTFALTWGFWFAAVYPRALPLMEAGKSVFSDFITTMFLVGVANPFVGPTATGIIGGIGFIVVGVFCLISLRKVPIALVDDTREGGLG